MKTIRVLITGPSLKDPGGVANYYNAVLPRLSGDGMEVQYLQIGRTHGGRFGLYVFGDPLRLWRTIGQFDPDIVHLNPSLDLRSFLRDGVFVFIGKLRRRKVLVFFRGWQQPFEQQVTGVLGRFFSATYAKADAFIVLAERFLRKLREWGVTAPIELSTTAVADELVEDLSIDEKIAAIGSADIVRLLYLARLEREKGILELIDAVGLLLKHGAPVSLTVAGDGPMMMQVKDRVFGLGARQDRVHVVGYVRGAAKKELLMSHHLLCFPTQYGEGMPNSMLEAMASGMAVMTCPIGGIRDFFEEPEMGVLLKNVEPEYMADKLETLILSRDRIARMAYNNYRYAQQHFLASIVASGLRGRYRLICAPNRNG